MIESLQSILQHVGRDPGITLAAFVTLLGFVAAVLGVYGIFRLCKRPLK